MRAVNCSRVVNAGGGGVILVAERSEFLHSLSIYDKPGGWKAEVMNKQDGQGVCVHTRVSVSVCVRAHLPFPSDTLSV